MPVFIMGTSFHPHKLVRKALGRFYGLGPQVVGKIMAKYSLHQMMRVGTLPARTVTALSSELSSMTIEGEARKLIQENVQRLKDMGTYRGNRHRRHLPVRGQKTRNQISTARKINRWVKT